MHVMHLAGSNRPGDWTKALHFFYAGLYAFVLPFICWGAQATPSHPHARPHFIFIDPPGHSQLIAESFGAAQSVVEWLAVYANRTLCGDHSVVAHPAMSTAETPQQPVGRATPVQLVISTLLPIGGLVIHWLLQADGPGTAVWLITACVTPFYTSIPTPPPR